MAYDIGPKIGIEGEAEFRKAIGDINTGMRTLKTEMQAVASQFDKNDKSQEAYTSKNDVLVKQIDLQKKKLEELRKGLKAAGDKYGENERVTQGWQQAVNKATAELNGMERELKNNTKAMDDATKKSNVFRAAIGSMGKSLVSIGTTAAKTAAAGIAAVGVAAGAAAIKLGKEVIAEFGELEQNLGGSEAVFGKYATSIQKAGEDAYKNLGASQSEYLATANKMGALFQGTGIEQQRSLELTEKAMQRAADMASVMGIDTSSALEAVTGAAKGNFTMMDNLGVAMNATNIEAYALAKGLDFTWKTATQAEKAEVAMQMFFETTEQYAGNFARESTETITGSIGLLKTAVQSFVGGLGNANADMSNLTSNVVDAFGAVVKNIVPVLENVVKSLPIAIQGLLEAATKLLPTLIEAAIGLFRQVLTSIIDTLPELIPVVLSALLLVVQTLAENGPMLVTAGVDAIMALIDGIVNALPSIIDAAIDIIMALVNSIINNLPKIIQAAVKIVLSLVDGILKLLPELIKAALELIVALAKGLIDALPLLIKEVPKIVKSIVDTIVVSLPLLIDAAIEIIIALIEAIIDNLPMLISAAMEINVAIAAGIIKALPEILATIPKLFTALKESFSKINWAELGVNIISGIASGVRDAAKTLANSVVDAAKSALDGAKNFLGIKSPSRVMRDEVGKMIGAGMAEGIADSAKQVDAAMKGLNNKLEVDSKYTTAPASTPTVIVNTPVNLDGKVITSATSRTQYKFNRASSRALGVVTG